MFRSSFAITLGLALGLGTGASADEVFPVQASFAASVQDGPAIAHVKFSGESLLNLARGRAPDAAVPAGEILAFRVDCGSAEGSLIVFDTGGNSVLATIATTERIDVVHAGSKGEFSMVLDVAESGNGDFAVHDGTLVVLGKLSIGGGSCPVSLKATASGVVDATTTDNVSTDDITAILSKGKFTTPGVSIATLP